MRLKVTLQPSHAAVVSRNILITADATATVGDLAAAIANGRGDDEPSHSQDNLTLRVTDSRSGAGSNHLSRHVSLLESGLRSGSSIAVVRAQPTEEIDRGPALATLKVHAGPDAGMEIPLRLGSSTIGRSSTCDVPLSDPTVSKHHARISVTDRVEVVDNNSANGVSVGGLRVTRLPVGQGDVVSLGSTQFSIVRLRTASATDSTSTDIPFVRSPRVLSRPTDAEIELPEVPKPPAPLRLPWLAMIAPLVMGVGLFAISRSVLSLAFVGLSPVIMLGNYVEQRSTSKRRHDLAMRTFQAELARAETDLRLAQQREREQLEAMHPTVADCLNSAERLSDLLWCRRPEHPEFLQVRLGTGTIAPHYAVKQRGSGGIADLVELEDRLRMAYATLPGAPVVADLRSVGGIGLCGSRAVLDGVTRAVVCQLATLHSPAELVVTCLTSAPEREKWSWLEWLPHTGSPHSPLGSHHLSADSASGKALLAHLEELVAVRARALGSSGAVSRGPVNGDEKELPEPTLPAVLVVVDDPLVDIARLTRIAERGPDVGIYVLWTGGCRAELVGACRAYLDVTDGGATSVGLVRRGAVIPWVTCESVNLDAAATVARTLSPVVDAGAPIDDESDLPRSVSMVTLFGKNASDDPAVVLSQWRENQSLAERRSPARPRDRVSDLTGLVGHAGFEAFTLDLRTQGPHALVGGTTGAGKSEFLQAWVLGMAHAYSPDRVTFLFVDYKGGAAFAKCIELPHCVGLVTDLSPYLVRRALRSLRAELRRRERILNVTGAKDLVELEKTGDPECPPSLIIVVDEFAALVGEVPQFVDGVVDVAQRGRSLGLHLILATQRPAGVIKDNLRANTNLRVALRMADDHDSLDVLGDAMAANFDPSVPGRGAAKTGPGRIVTFQSAFPGARTPDVSPTPPIDIEDLAFGSGRKWRLPERGRIDRGIPTDIERVVATIAKAAHQGNVPAPRRPWLEPLGDVYNLETLPHLEDAHLVLGVLDDPDEQTQVTEYFSPDEEGNILYIGAGGSGKSTALRSLAIASAMTARPGLVHIYGLDFSGGALASLTALPSVGAVIDGDDEERVGRLLRHVSRLVDERAARYSSVRASTLVEYRQLATQPHEPRLLLLLDGFAAFRAEYESAVGLSSPYNTFQRLLVDGRAVGVHVAMTADRPTAVPMSVSSAFQRKVVLRQTDEDAYVATGTPKDVLSSASPPGRALQVDRPQELQLAILGDNVTAAAQGRLIEELGEELEARIPRRPEPILSLPAVVSAGGLPRDVGGMPALGVADETLQPVGFPASGVILVAGPVQSGRTSAVRWLAESVHRRHPMTPLVHLSARRSPLTDLPLWTNSAASVDAIVVLLDTVKSLVSQQPLEEAPLLALFVEHFTDLVGTAAEMSLQEIVKQCRRNGHPLVAEGESTTWASSWGLITEVRNARTGLLLQPDQFDGENILRTALPRVRRSDFPPGRGFWIRAGKAVKVQIPLVE